MKMNRSFLRLVACVLVVFACTTRNLPQAQQTKEPAKSSESTPSTPPGPGGTSLPNADPFPSTYRPFPSRTTLIRNATIMTAAGPSIQNASVLLRDGKIAAVGTSVTAPSDAVVSTGPGSTSHPASSTCIRTSATIRLPVSMRTATGTKRPTQ